MVSSSCACTWLETAINILPLGSFVLENEFNSVESLMQTTGLRALFLPRILLWPLTHTILLTIPSPSTRQASDSDYVPKGFYTNKFRVDMQHNFLKKKTSFEGNVWMKPVQGCRWRNWKRWVMTSDPLQGTSAMWSVKVNHWNDHPFRRGRVNPARKRKPSIERHSGLFKALAFQMLHWIMDDFVSVFYCAFPFCFGCDPI